MGYNSNQEDILSKFNLDSANILIICAAGNEVHHPDQFFCIPYAKAVELIQELQKAVDAIDAGIESPDWVIERRK